MTGRGAIHSDPEILGGDARIRLARGKFPVSDGDDFSFRTSGDGAVSIRFHGRSVTVLRGKAAARFLTRVAGTDAAGAQLEMAKATGNFRRGNERQAKARERGRLGR